MSIYRSGGFRRSGGVVSAIKKQLESVNLKAVKRITFSFDPFGENILSTREVLTYLSAPKITQTNPKCIYKTEVLCNRKPAEIKFSILPEIQEKAKTKEFKFLCDNLSTLELLQLCNKHISVLAPKEEITTTVQTKSAKKAGKIGVKR